LTHFGALFKKASKQRTVSELDWCQCNKIELYARQFLPKCALKVSENKGLKELAPALQYQGHELTNIQFGAQS